MSKKMERCYECQLETNNFIRVKMGQYGYEMPVNLCYECDRKNWKDFNRVPKYSTESTILTFQEWLGSKAVAAWGEAIREGEAEPFPNELSGFVYWTSTPSCLKYYIKWYQETCL